MVNFRTPTAVADSPASPEESITLIGELPFHRRLWGRATSYKTPSIGEPSTPTSMISRMASSVVQELTRTKAKLKKSASTWTPWRYTPTVPSLAEDPMPLVMRSSTKEQARKTQSSAASTGSSSSLRQRFSRLSLGQSRKMDSAERIPTRSALHPALRAPSYLLFTPLSMKISSTKFLDMSDSCIVAVLKALRGVDLWQVRTVCRRLFRIIDENFEELDHIRVKNREFLVRYNVQRDEVDVTALKCGRSIRDVAIIAASLTAILPPLIDCDAKVSFGNGVLMSEWKDELLELYKKKRLRPTTLVFTGGSFTKGYRMGGADVRCWNEEEFVAYCSQFKPHLREVQLATTKHFKMTTSPPRILSMISVVETFGITYERPAMKIHLDDLRQVVTFWRSDGQARSCDIYIREPSPDDEMSGMTTEEEADDSFIRTTNDQRRDYADWPGPGSLIRREGRVIGFRFRNHVHTDCVLTLHFQ